MCVFFFIVKYFSSFILKYSSAA